MSMTDNHVRARAALHALVNDPEAGIANGTCVYCHYRFQDDTTHGLDASDIGAIYAPAHTEDCPIVRGRLVLSTYPHANEED